MGINGLLQFLKPIQKEQHISSYAGQRVAIDSYCWLHKSLYTCAVELAKGIPTDRWVLFCLRRIEMLLSYNITVVAVFDGAMLPVKKSTEVERENSRLEARRKADELLKKGQHDLAYRKFAESIDVTPELAFSLYKALQEKYQIECVVSPYEADAQLAYLSRTNYVDVVITEDSDLLAFGAKKVFYKMDQSGNGSEIALEDYKISKELKMYDWDDKMFLSACILSGCDYLPSVKGIGMKTAYKLISEYRTYRKIIDCLRIDSKYNVPANYLDDFEKAYITFRFQMIFCPKKQKLLMLNGSELEELRSQLNNEPHQSKIPTNLENLIDMNLLQKMLTLKDLNFLGPVIPEQTARDIAYGIIDPISLKPYLSGAISVGKRSSSFGDSIDFTPKLQHNPKSLEVGNMLEKVSGEKYFKISKKPHNVPFLAKKAQSQLSISNFFTVNGQKSNLQLSQSLNNNSLGKKFIEDFATPNENSLSDSQFRDSKGLRAPYRPPKTMIKSVSLDIECTASREDSNRVMIDSAKENIPEVILETHDEKPLDSFGSPFGFLKGLDKKRRYVSRHDLLDEAEQENGSDALHAHPVLKKSKTTIESRFHKSRASDNFVVDFGNFDQKICDLSTFAFKRADNNTTPRIEEGLSLKDLNSMQQGGLEKLTILNFAGEVGKAHGTNQNLLLSLEDPSLQKEDLDAHFTAKKLNRQFSEGSESTKATLTQKFRELVEMDIEFEHEEHNLNEVDKKLQRLELLFDYKGPVLDFKQVLASTV